MSKENHDNEITEVLRKSLNQAGELQPVAVCKQHPEVILSGTHRSIARGGLANVVKKEFVDVEAYAKRVGIPHELAEISIKLHANVHRRVSTEETQEQVLSIAKGLEAAVPKNEIASKLEEFLPFSPSYILRLLPPEYKQKEYARSQGRHKKKNTESDVDDPGHQSPGQAKVSNSQIAEKTSDVDQSVSIRCSACGQYVPASLAAVACNSCLSQIPRRKSRKKTPMAVGPAK